MDKLNDTNIDWKSFAITIAINPRTMITMYNEKDAKTRLRWEDYGYEDQKHFLLRYIQHYDYLDLPKSWMLIQYQYELTQAGNYHLHANVDFNANMHHDECLTYLDTAMVNFCNLISEKMTDTIRRRTVFVKQVYAKTGWMEYIRKDIPKPEPVISPEIKLRKKLFI